MHLSLLDYMRLARGVPLHQLPGKAWNVLARCATNRWRQVRDRCLGTHPPDRDLLPGQLPRWSMQLEAGAWQGWQSRLERAADEVLAHRFDLLGSGPVRVFHGLQAQGVEGHRYASDSEAVQVNRSNRPMARRIVQACGTPDYVPIDWHVDFKSGFRWPQAAGHHQIDYGVLPGVDVKVPWELARCQHLPALMLAALGADAERKTLLVREFRNQVLDFVAHNPPRFGVNWCCTMDVAIRAANWVLAYQLSQQLDVAPDPVFEREFQRSLWAHGRHVVNHLEWFEGLRSNHYLSNVCGLLFVAIQLPQNDETDAWIALAAPELVRECLEQFQDDGSNFEGSTSYHRLSGEMVCYALALLRSVPQERLRQALTAGLRGLRFDGPGPDPRNWVRPQVLVAGIPWTQLAQRMQRARDFSQAVTRPDGAVAQIGDNDSGRFFRLAPELRLKADGQWHQPAEDHRHLWAAMDALLSGQAGCDHPDAHLVCALSGGIGMGDGFPAVADGAEPGDWAFPDFGLYVHASARVWCALRGGAVGQRGHGGHAHNDQLAMELCVDGVAFLVDPGTYLYTPLPQRRNQLRATAAHNTIADVAEQNGWQSGRLGLFGMDRVGRFDLLRWDALGWAGRYRGQHGRTSTRTVSWCVDGLEVSDTHEGVFELNFQLMPGCEVEIQGAGQLRLRCLGRTIGMTFDAGQCIVTEGVYSPAYGRLEVAPRITVRGLQAQVGWTLHMQTPKAPS